MFQKKAFVCDFGSKIDKKGNFHSFHFWTSVLQTDNRNQYGSCLSDQLIIPFLVKKIINGNFIW